MRGCRAFLAMLRAEVLQTLRMRETFVYFLFPAAFLVPLLMVGVLFWVSAIEKFPVVAFPVSTPVELVMAEAMKPVDGSKLHCPGDVSELLNRLLNKPNQLKQLGQFSLTTGATGAACPTGWASSAGWTGSAGSGQGQGRDIKTL